MTTALELEVGTRDVAKWYRQREGGQRIHYGVSIGHIPVRMIVMEDSGDFLPSGPANSEAAIPTPSSPGTEGSLRGSGLCTMVAV